MTETKALARQEFRSHWTLVAATAIGFSFSSVMTAATGLFMEPLGQAFGWSRTLQSSGVSIAAATTFLLSPLFGVFIDRWGTRRLALPGLVVMALTMAAFSTANGSAWQWVGLWTIYAFSALATKSTVWTAAVTSTFDAGRGLALGLTLSGTAVAQAITPPLANYLIETQGWRAAFVWLGLGWGSVAILACWFWLFDGYDRSRRARAKDGAAKSRAPLLDVPGLSIAQAWRDTALWRIAISTFVMMIITIALNVHQFPILVEAGVSRGDAALYSSVAGIAGVVGKLVTGWLLDRYPGRWVGAITLGLTSVTFILLLLPGRTPAIIVAAMFINGYAAGTKLQIAGYLTAVYAGMRNFGAVFGAMASLIAAGSGLGPLLGGVVYDAYGTYDPFLVFGIVGTVFSALLILGLGPYPPWARAPSRTAG